MFDGGRDIVCEFSDPSSRIEIEPPFILYVFFYSVEPPKEFHARIESDVVAEKLKAHDESDDVRSELHYTCPLVTQKILKKPGVQYSQTDLKLI